jgi:hypothetical protein
MAVRGDEVAGSIDAHVREAVERMVGEIRSSIEDVRAAVDSQLEAALQSVQADVKSLTFLPHIKKTVGELEESITSAKPAPAAPSRGDASRVRTALQAVESGKSQVDILNALLEQCLHFGSRAALLILRGETFSGWKGVGFAAHGGNDEAIKKFNAAPGLVPELDTVLRQERVAIWDGQSVSSRFGMKTSDRAILVPMVIKDKVSAAVYVDAIGADVAKLDTASIEILVFTTGLLIDTLAIRKKVPSPSLTESGDQPAARPAAAPAPPPPPGPTPAPTRAAAPPPPSRPVSAPVASPAPAEGSTVAIDSKQIRDMLAAQSRSTAAPAPAAPAPARPAAAPAAAPAHPLGGDDKPSTQFVPPAGVARGGALGGGQTDDVKRHDEARRFARLLVSEIKLYNEAKVEQGRKNKDLYERLKEDIDRSRQMYDERIHEDVRKTSNYFYDELVRILADGNSDSLGL